MTATRQHLLKLLLAPLVTLACGLVLFLAVNHTSGDGTPADGAGAAVEVPPGATTDQRIAILQRAARDGVAGAEDYAALGDAYLQKARETGDPGYYTRAGRGFDVALHRDARNVTAVLGEATLAGLRHDFGDQLRLGLAASRLEPGIASLPVIADAQIELGRYATAARTIQRMLDRKPNLTSYSRLSYYRELSGDVHGAVEAMGRAASAGGAPENTAYVEVLLGDLELQRGRTGAARQAYTAALRSLPGYPAGMVGLARADAAGGELGRAAARLRLASDRLPLTSTLTLLAEVEAARGQRGAAATALATARAEQGLYRAARTRPDAEAVLFEANHGSPSAAVALGRRVWAAAPSLRSADALGWALTRSGQPAAGYSFARRALRLGSRDALFRLHAGVAAKRAGLGGEAARHLAIAWSARTALSPASLAQLEEARR
jgi:tetratricopeptide (TPR) repeat protein